ncbi:MAG: aminoglycoside phosphotransferase family protein [Sulfitobacter sp.]
MALVTSRADEIAAFLHHIGWATADRVNIAGDASARRYDRLTLPDGQRAVLMDAPPNKGEDVRPFVTIAEHLRAHGLSAPEIYHCNSATGLLLIEDFGDALFARLMAADPANIQPLYTASIDVLIKLRQVPILDLPVCDATWLTDMLEPVFEWYAPDASRAMHTTFVHMFRPLAEQVATADKNIMLRDYHAENLLLLEDRGNHNRVGILDFQDAMLAHPAYDLVSLLQDARRDVSSETEAEIMAYYLRQTDTPEEPFKTDYAILGLQRNLRILGIFARLCLRDGKPQYLDKIPRVWGYIIRNLGHPALRPLAPHVIDMLPEPTPSFLDQLKSKCPQAPPQL